MSYTAHDTVPIVEPNDSGLRDSKPGECFYCHQSIGQAHLKTCVCVNARVRYRVKAKLPSGLVLTGLWTTYDPWAWFENGEDPETADLAGHWQFARNQGCWCTDNCLNDVVWDQPGTLETIEAAVKKAEHGCSCSFVELDLDDVLDNRYHTEDPK